MNMEEVKTAKIKSIKYIGEEPVYNMEVKDHHNFSVNGGLIVHNSGYGLLSYHDEKSSAVKGYDIDWSRVPEDYLEDYERAPDDWKKIILDRWRAQGLFKRK
jgi:hypothetical protein